MPLESANIHKNLNIKACHHKKLSLSGEIIGLNTPFSFFLMKLACPRKCTTAHKKKGKTLDSPIPNVYLCTWNASKDVIPHHSQILRFIL